jgi:hypothetical protein
MAEITRLRSGCEDARIFWEGGFDEIFGLLG